MKRFILGGIGCLFVVACSSNGTASVNGTVLGLGISPSSAFVVGDTTVFISSNGDACADLQSDTNRRNSRDLVIDVGQPISVGTFPIAHATFQSFDEACNAPADTTTTTGTVTFASIDTSGTLNVTGAVHGATGTYDITFGNDHITGSFTAADCTLSDLPTPTACR